MDRSRVRLLASFFAFTFSIMLAACGAAPQPSPTPLPPLRIGYDQWIGLSGLYTALDKGYFKQDNVNVEWVYYDSYDKAAADFAAQKLDGNMGVFSDIVAQSAANIPLQTVWITDTSAGADIVVGSSAVATPQDLKGKRIGLSYGTFGQAFVIAGLAKFGLTSDDVKIINTSAEDIPQKLASGEIDAGQTWEPYASTAVSKGAHVLFTSADTPGIINSGLFFRTDVVTKRFADVKAVIQTMLKGQDYWQKNPNDANVAVAKALGAQPGDIPGYLQGVKILSPADDLAIFTASNTPSLYTSAKTISDIFLKAGVIKQAPDVNAIINPAFAQALAGK